jgi:hypothetical protein
VGSVTKEFVTVRGEKYYGKDGTLEFNFKRFSE